VDGHHLCSHNYVRVGDKLFLHGSVASRLMKTLAGGAICLSVTLLDGIVCAHRNGPLRQLRSVVVMGKANPSKAKPQSSRRCATSSNT